MLVAALDEQPGVVPLSVRSPRGDPTETSYLVGLRDAARLMTPTVVIRLIEDSRLERLAPGGPDVATVLVSESWRGALACDRDVSMATLVRMICMLGRHAHAE